MRIISLLILLYTSLSAQIYPVDIRPSETTDMFQSIKILDQKEIIIKNISGIPFEEASDLAYDAKNKRLYMVGDGGSLYTFALTLGDKIEDLHPIAASSLAKKNGKKFKKDGRDSEGLTLDSKGRLIVSFERKPKIGTFSLDGRRIKKHTLPKKLQNRKNYKSRNKMLESVALHPKYGIVTAAELPIGDAKEQTIYSLSGKEWHFLAESDTKSSVTSIEVMHDGNLLVLERAYSKLSLPLVVTLKKVYINKKHNGLCKTKVLAKMDTDSGWKLDNFEGLTRVAPHRYLMISDDNGNFFQRTLLIYFEVMQ